MNVIFLGVNGSLSIFLLIHIKGVFYPPQVTLPFIPGLMPLPSSTCLTPSLSYLTEERKNLTSLVVVPTKAVRAVQQNAESAGSQQQCGDRTRKEWGCWKRSIMIVMRNSISIIILCNMVIDPSHLNVHQVDY